MYTGALKASFIITGSLSVKKELAGTQVPLNHLLIETPFAGRWISSVSC